MKAILWATIIVIDIAVGITARAAQTWQPFAKACGQEAETTFCVGKAGCPGWPWVATCVVHKMYGTQVSDDELQSCVTQEWNKRWAGGPKTACAACGTPVPDIVRCVGGN